jgi:hypothetical protein
MSQDKRQKNAKPGTFQMEYATFRFIRTSNPSNFKSFKPQTLQTFQTSNSSDFKLFKPFKLQTLQTLLIKETKSLFL